MLVPHMLHISIPRDVLDTSCISQAVGPMAAVIAVISLVPSLQQLLQAHRPLFPPLRRQFYSIHPVHIFIPRRSLFMGFSNPTQT
jgi:hypothetical protein